jgi:hypothetical protein
MFCDRCFKLVKDHETKYNVFWCNSFMVHIASNLEYLEWCVEKNAYEK